MSTFWIAYWITFGAIFVLTGVIALLFELDDEPISVSYVVLMDILGAIPAANFLVGTALIILILIGVCEEDLTPKY